MMVGGGQVAVVAGYDDCLAVLRHPRALSDRRRSAVFRRAAAMADSVPTGMRWAVETPSFLFLDPPDHTRLRRLVAQAFTARRVEQLRPTIEGLTADLLDAAGSEMDVVGELAYPLPLTVIADLLGVPREDTPRLREWSAVLTRALDPYIALTGQPAEGLERRMAALTEFREYFQRLVELRRRDPGDDLVSALTAAEDGGDRLSSEELLSTCVLLLVAGHETTVNLIANGVLALLRHPGQFAMLAANLGGCVNLIWPHRDTLIWPHLEWVPGREAKQDDDLVRGVASAPPASGVGGVCVAWRRHRSCRLVRARVAGRSAPTTARRTVRPRHPSREGARLGARWVAWGTRCGRPRRQRRSVEARASAGTRASSGTHSGTTRW